jgi:2'-5' RNA ligase
VDSLVIVAVPDETDPVWKVSSEKIPHLTLLFLGEDSSQVDNVDQIVTFVEHAANTMLNRFYLTVDRRGTLGEDQADVVFFKKDRYDFKAVWDFRAALLQDTNIRKAYDSSPQFDGWNPHLTLGYPAAPAKDDDQIGPLYSVLFNKIQVWTSDSEGPEFLLKDYDFMDDIPMDVAMSAIRHAKVSDKPWSNFSASDYDEAQWARACLLDRGSEVEGKQRYGLPVREPDGTVNRNACHAAAAVLSSVGGTGSARGNKVKGSAEQLAAAKRKLISLYKNTLDEDVPQGLGGEMKQSVSSELDTAVKMGTEFIEHYGVKGMKWGVRNAQGGSNTSGVGETKREGIQKFLDPQGHSLKKDVAKLAVGTFIPVLKPLTLPAEIRAYRGAYRGAKAKALDRQEKKFAKKAMSTKNFVKIHNGAVEKANRDLVDINKRYPKPNQNAATQKKYDAEVLKSMQKAYTESANSIGNKKGTQHLEIEFVNDTDFRIHAREGAPTPMPQRVKHADGVTEEEFTLEFSGKILRDADGHILGLKFDDFEDQSVQHTISTGEAFLEHYGVKGMRWGVRKAAAVTTQEHIDAGLLRRRTKVVAKGGQSAPAHNDAVKAAVQKQLIKKSGTNALSTQELRDLANRLQVENQVQLLLSSKGKQYVKGQLESQGKQALGRGVAKAAPHVVKKAKKTAATASTAALLL